MNARGALTRLLLLERKIKQSLRPVPPMIICGPGEGGRAVVLSVLLAERGVATVLEGEAAREWCKRNQSAKKGQSDSERRATNA